MAEATMRCPHCHREAVVKYGKTSTGKERFRCQQTPQCGRTFLRSYAYAGCLPAVKQQIVDMTLNGSGIRDITRVLHVGPNTVLKELKKSGRPLPGQHQRSRRLLSGRNQGRSTPRRSRGGRRNVEFCGEQSAATVAMARD
jgi:transposase-like protein